MTVLVLVLLVLPVWLFYQLSMNDVIYTSPDTLAFLVLFTMLFSLAIIIFTRRRGMRYLLHLLRKLELSLCSTGFAQNH